jgi:hypothetical protein
MIVQYSNYGKSSITVKHTKHTDQVSEVRLWVLNVRQTLFRYCGQIIFHRGVLFLSASLFSL